MLPLSLLQTGVGHIVLVELKNGETYNGNLVNCDGWMNINLREVVCTSRDGERFWRIPQCYIRGNTIKYINFPKEIIDKVQENVAPRGSTRGRGGVTGRGRGATPRGRQEHGAQGRGRGSYRGGRGYGPK
ncbi:U6 snRNA-associated Sm-like protein LSm4 [Balamuthia mandrillaris]